MMVYRRSSTVRQMAAAVAAFVVCVGLLESGGLYDWAERLELGPLRTVALPVAAGLHKVVGRTGLERVRVGSIRELARVRWSDDPAAAEGSGMEAGGAEIPAETAGLAEDIADGKMAAKPGVVPEDKLGPVAAPTPKAPLLPVAGDPPLVTELGDSDAREGVRVVALAGDSMMAVGLSATMLRQSVKYPGLKFVKAFKSGTGLTRPEVFDWAKEYPAMLAGVKPDVVIVAIGANDGQGFVQDGVTYPFGGEGWKRIYQERVAAYLEMVAQPGVQVVWLGLPPMKSESYNAHIALVNRIAYTVVKAHAQATWFSTAGRIGEADGAFRDFGDVNGKQTQLRAGDGIHFSDEGAKLVTEPLFAWLAAVPKDKTPRE